MKFHDSTKVFKARELRKTGLTFAQIAKELIVNERTISRWCHTISGNTKSHQCVKARHIQIGKDALRGLKPIVVDDNQAKILASVLYWAEGGKYPQTTGVSFCNSDPEMVKFFIKLLRISFPLDESLFRVHLQIHDNQNQEVIFDYWSGLLQIPVTKFWKPTITTPTRKMKRVDYMGTCTLRYHDYKILLSLTEIYKSLSNGKVAEWPKAAHC